AGSGVWAFAQPFSIQVIGLHALTGFVFIAVIGLHIANNFVPLKKYLKSRVVWVVVAITAALGTLFYIQPSPIKAVLGLSGNLGPALDRFEMTEEGMKYDYVPSPSYKLSLDIRTGSTYSLENPPRLAVWLENQSFYHIKTLYASEFQDTRESLPYWAFKVKGWERAQDEARIKGIDLNETVEAVSGATQNGSFDPADYILPGETNASMPFRVMIEVNQPDDPTEKLKDQPSLVYQVEVDNFDPRTFQLLELVGYPVREVNDQDEEEWAIYYVDDKFGSALDLIDSALLTIGRDGEK
ncbi:MAG: hypothetical protein VX969_04855, partial [Verrucomicrobiota bacterium]|nr:hypothetical protein [Verrucomicrobiota bacterium]